MLTRELTISDQYEQTNIYLQIIELAIPCYFVQFQDDIIIRSNRSVKPFHDVCIGSGDK